MGKKDRFLTRCFRRALKKKSPHYRRVKKYFPPDDRVVSDAGVSVAHHGRDQGPEHLWLDEERSRDGDLVLQDMQVSVAQGRTRVARRLDSVSRLLAEREIDDRLWTAGDRFHTDFESGHYSGLKASKFEWTPPSTSGEGTMNTSMEKARKRVRGAMAYLDTPVQREAAWEIIGNQVSLAKISGGTAWKRDVWKRNLITTLNKLADFYGV